MSNQPEKFLLSLLDIQIEFHRNISVFFSQFLAGPVKFLSVVEYKGCPRLER